MSSPRALALSWSCALALFACDAPPTPQQTPPADAARQDPDAAAKAEAVAQEHYLKALELEAAGRYVEAKIEVDQALTNGAGRDAHILAAKLAVLRNDLPAASDLLARYAGDTNDALVQYNLGLIAQRRNEYNRARNAYLAAAKADPTLAAARFNLAILTWDAGVQEEARHHARKFLEMAPADPRGAELRAKVQLDAGPAGATPAGPATGAATAVDPAPGTRPAPAAKTDDAGLKDPFNRKDQSARDVNGLKDPLAKKAG
ncbi:MAG: hypothetical protein JNL82_16595 [Myxococcales bacterium]|nr:hypothetical protein [Myxococcales bacterium]